jgi:hypothetical protein
MNLLMVIAVYGTLAKALGVPMSFPDSRAAYDALYQITDTRILASAVDAPGGIQHAEAGGGTRKMLAQTFSAHHARYYWQQPVCP